MICNKVIKLGEIQLHNYIIEVTDYLFASCSNYPPLEACAGNLVQICPRLVIHDKVPANKENILLSFKQHTSQQ